MRLREDSLKDVDRQRRQRNEDNMKHPPELFEKMPDGLMRCSRYGEYLRITEQSDSGDVFAEWLQIAYTANAIPLTSRHQ